MSFELHSPPVPARRDALSPEGPLSRDRRPSRGPRATPHEQWESTRYVLCHPLHMSVATTVLATTLLVGSAWMFLALLVAEALTLGVLPRSPTVARRATRYRRERRRIESAQARAALHAQMEPSHVHELLELERRIAAARAHAGAVSESVEVLFDEWLAPDRLLDGYVRISIAHRSARESAQLADASQLMAEIAALELERDTARSSRLRRLAERRIELSRRRLACLKEAEEQRDALASEIASVAALLRLVQERTTAVVAQGDLHAEIERLVNDVQLCDDAMHEVHAATSTLTAAAGIADPLLVRVADELAQRADAPLETESELHRLEQEIETRRAARVRRASVG